MTTIAIVLAAGQGTRARNGVNRLPKQYVRVNGQTAIRESLKKLASHPEISALQAVIRQQDETLYHEATQDIGKLLAPCLGGDTRQASVLCGLKAIQSQAPCHVLIHDAARPYFSTSLIDQLLAGLHHTKAIIPLLPASDTLYEADKEGVITSLLDRSRINAAQTPQAFDYQTLLRCHTNATGGSYSDDASLCFTQGIRVGAVSGEAQNKKITYPGDLRSDGKEFRHSAAYDSHRFMPGRAVRLAGLDIPAPFALEGHSDADVVLHALTDAVYGLTGDGDIGTHFPPSDMKWRAVRSAQFLSHARARLQAAGGGVHHIDITIIAQTPKLVPHRAAIINNIAHLLAVPETAVSLKATTNEGMGFIGCNEGIACMVHMTGIFSND